MNKKLLAALDDRAIFKMRKSQLLLYVSFTLNVFLLIAFSILVVLLIK